MTHFSSQAGGAHSRLVRILLAFLVLASVTVFGVAATPAPTFANNTSCSRGCQPLLGVSGHRSGLARCAPGRGGRMVEREWSHRDLDLRLSRSDRTRRWPALGTPGKRQQSLVARHPDPARGPNRDGASHHGRANTDTVVVRIGSPSSLVDQGTFSTGTTAFVRYSGNYVVPDGQTTDTYSCSIHKARKHWESGRCCERSRWNVAFRLLRVLRDLRCRWIG